MQRDEDMQCGAYFNVIRIASGLINRGHDASFKKQEASSTHQDMHQSSIVDCSNGT